LAANGAETESNNSSYSVSGRRTKRIAVGLSVGRAGSGDELSVFVGVVDGDNDFRRLGGLVGCELPTLTRSNTTSGVESTELSETADVSLDGGSEARETRVMSGEADTLVGEYEGSCDCVGELIGDEVSEGRVDGIFGLVEGETESRNRVDGTSLGPDGWKEAIPEVGAGGLR
jgi:hypothetical protein